MRNCVNECCQFNAGGECITREEDKCSLIGMQEKLNDYHKKMLVEIEDGNWFYQDHFLQKIAYEFSRLEHYESSKTNDPTKPKSALAVRRAMLEGVGFMFNDINYWKQAQVSSLNEIISLHRLLAINEKIVKKACELIASYQDTENRNGLLEEGEEILDKVGWENKLFKESEKEVDSKPLNEFDRTYGLAEVCEKIEKQVIENIKKIVEYVGESGKE